MTLLWIALGGALGAVARYGLSGWVQGLAGSGFPWGTMTVNALGSAALGLAVAWLESAALSADVRSFATVGLLGAFTTFSTFTFETLALVRDGDWSRAGGYLAGSLALGLAAVAAGFAAGTLLLRWTR